MRLHTQIEGLHSRGFPVLCLHGHPGSGKAMDVFTTALSHWSSSDESSFDKPSSDESSSDGSVSPFTTYAPDLRGYGRSRTSYPFEMTRHLDDLEELLAQHDITKCVVLGWSLGGILAMELALRRPDVVKGLILIGTAARPRGSHPPISLKDNMVTGIAGVLNWILPAFGPAILRERRLAIALGKKSLFRYLIRQHTPEAYRYLARRGAPAFLRTSRYAETALFQAIRSGYNRVPDIKTLTIPSVMLCGECDRHITADASLETARALPNCEVHCYPDTAHLFPWEIPARVNVDIRKWLEAHADIWQS